MPLVDNWFGKIIFAQFTVATWNKIISINYLQEIKGYNDRNYIFIDGEWSENISYLNKIALIV